MKMCTNFLHLTIALQVEVCLARIHIIHEAKSEQLFGFPLSVEKVLCESASDS